MGIKNEFDSRKKEYEKILYGIEQATDFVIDIDFGDGYLKYFSSCDSSDLNEIRVRYVKKALEEFINNNKKEILKLAANLCRNYIDS